MIKFGLISFAHVHSGGYAWALKQMHDQDQSVKLIAIADDDVSRGKASAEEWKTEYFADYRELLSSGKVDAVIIASENARHVDQVSAAAAAGIHIICEKPVGINHEQLEKMRDCLRKSAVVFQTAFVVRFSPSVVEAKLLLDGGTLGAVRAISSTNHGRYPGGWFGEREQSGGGAIIDHTVHVADAIRLLTGDEFSSVRAYKGKNLRTELMVEDNALIYGHMLRSGVPVSIDCSWSRHDKWPTWGDLQVNIYCEKGVIKVDAFRSHLNLATAQGFTWESLGEDLNVKLIRSFCRAIAEQQNVHSKAPKCNQAEHPWLRASFEDGAKAASIAFAAYASLDKNSELISLPFS